MGKIKIGILKEGKIPVDRRVPLSPLQAKELVAQFENIHLVCQSSPIRCFSDEEYIDAGIPVVEEVDDCEILLGVKEVPLKDLIPRKTYFFFSHTIKKQVYNRKLLQAVLENKIKLIDYECLTDREGNRLIAFGRYAGIVGAYNGILTYGLKYHIFDLRRARDCYDLQDLKTEFSKVKLPPIKIALTGGGRAANGAMEVLDGMQIAKVSPQDFLTKSFGDPVYAQLRSRDYNSPKMTSGDALKSFYEAPETYQSNFAPYAAKADLLIAAAYWDPKAPALFTREDMMKANFSIKVIADITCDIEGSIPSTKRPSTIDDPVYDYNPWMDKLEKPYSGESYISVMAVDNLPCELPRDASNDFGNEMKSKILPFLFLEDKEEVLKRATIADDGQLTPPYRYLQSYIDGGQ